MRHSLFGLHAFSAIATVAAEFFEPPSSTGDFYTSYSLGEAVDIKWNPGWNWGKGAQPDRADLFIMWFDRPTEFSQLVQANVSLETRGNFRWTVDVPEDKIAAQPKFVFRFSQHTDPPVFNWDNPKMPSRGIIINNSKGTKSSSSSATSSSSSRFTSSSTSQRSSPPPNTAGAETSPSPAKPSTKKKKKGSSNTGVIAGAVLGGLVGLALICGAALLLLKRIKEKRKAEAERDAPLVEAMGDTKHGGAVVYAHELQTAPAELAGHKPDRSSELQGSSPRDWH